MEIHWDPGEISMEFNYKFQLNSNENQLEIQLKFQWNTDRNP